MLGLTFKPNTDDMRDAPSLSVATALADAGVSVRAYDPEGMEAARLLMPEIFYCHDAYAAAAGADAVVIVTEWDAFRGLNFARLSRLVANAVLVDLRNIYRRDAVESAGFEYHAVGR